MQLSQENEQTLEWWQKAVVYQIYPRSFKDSNNDGIGDLPGITGKLDYLAWLGVDAIWLSPFYPSPMNDGGYDIADYQNVHPNIGTLQDFERMVDRAHQLGLKVIVDFVPNHTSDQHAWFKESRSSRDNPKRDWYFWQDGKPGSQPPNNWISSFGGSAWEWDEQSGQYYLHSFLTSQPDLNWRNPDVKNAMFDVLRFWMDRGVDGFRIDVAHQIMKDPLLRDNPPNPNPMAPPGMPLRDFNMQLHVNDQEHPDVHVIYRELRALLNSYSHGQPRAAIGEIHVSSPAEWATYYGANLDEIHLPFNFGLLRAEWRSSSVRTVVDTLEKTLPPGAWPNYVMGNHDEPRIVSRIGEPSARLAMLLLLTLRGTPTLYYGDELAMHDVTIPPERIQDGWEKQSGGLGVSRDPQRTPMQWDSSPNGGFTAEGVQPWLPLADDYDQLNVKAETDQSASMLTLTHRLLQLRRVTPALVGGSYEALNNVPPDCYAFLRRSAGQTLLVALNFSGKEETVKLDQPGQGNVLLSTRLDREGPVDLSAITLRAHEACIIVLS
ncbi:MAG TPA: alpha-amylase family glycosyl hydrolase [Chloroflexia bacterium]|nr:alpha-amylase family glycosyl hydrolase [Chloroflexia bacterium]